MSQSTTRRRGHGCARRAPSSSARRTCRRCSRTGSRRMPSTAPRTIRRISAAPRAGGHAVCRGGAPPAIPWITLDNRIASTLEDLATRLDKLGCTVKRVQPDGLGDWKEHYLLYRTLLTMMTTPRLPPERRQLYL